MGRNHQMKSLLAKDCALSKDRINVGKTERMASTFSNLTIRRGQTYTELHSMKTYFKRDDEGIFRQNERPVKLNVHKMFSMKVKKGKSMLQKGAHFQK